MKLVHQQAESIADLLAQGKESELVKDWDKAEKIYYRILQRHNHHLQSFQRLMIIYRKQKAFSKELTLINKAIEAFGKLYAPKTAHNRRVQTLSAKINKAFGMVDRKGNSVYEPGPMATWKKRKIFVEKRLTDE